MNADLKFDFHTHHDRCGHARGTIRDYIEASIDKGFDIIGISDHSPYFGSEKDQPHPHIAMGKSAFSGYVAEILKLKEDYKEKKGEKIEVLLGVESDFFPEHAEIYRSYYEKYPFDYIIGSVHQVDEVSIFHKTRWEGLSQQEKQRTKETYYQLIEESARSRMFQILGHIDARKDSLTPFSFSSIQTAVIDQTLKVISAHDIAIEVNTSGKTQRLRRLVSCR